MGKYKILGCPSLPNIPWKEMPAEEFKCAPIWRCTQNPIIGRNPVRGVARIFNSAVMPYKGEFIGVFRGEQPNGIPAIYLGISNDGISWTFDEEKIRFVDVLLMRTAMSSCRDTPMIRDLSRWRTRIT